VEENVTSMDQESTSSRIMTFYRAIPGIHAPMRADRGALGILPTGAFQYCEPVTSASAFGWYVFPPMSFHLQWDGTDVLWTHDAAESWFPLTSCHFPSFPAHFDESAPDDIKGYAPPFLTRVFAPGIVQIWSGLLAKTAPGWSLLIRPPANIPRSQSYEPFEGIVETDRRLGPLFVNIRLTATDRPIEFRTENPLFQVQPLKRETYAEKHLKSFELVESLTELTTGDWNAYRATVVAPNRRHYRPVGQYAVSVRKRAHEREVPLSIDPPTQT
jgi:hypothetical protein